MPFYNDLRPDSDHKKKGYAALFPGMTEKEKIRCLRGLLELRNGLEMEIAPKIADKNLIIASWNIREFGHLKKRLPETYFYIAEILNRFDLIAVQEVKSSLDDLDIVMRLLGSDWKFMVNDITEGNDGNSERSAYIYNTKRVKLAGIAGEIALHDKLTQNSTIKQFKRAPYITGFVAGWKKFSLINVHLHPNDGRDDLAFRKEEVRLLLAAIQEKIDRGRFWNENLILVGDFNFYSGARKDDVSIQMLYDAGFKEIEALKEKDTNASLSEAYDRLFFKVNQYFRIGLDEEGRERGGVFNPFLYLFREHFHQDYRAQMLADYGGSKDLGDPELLRKYFLRYWRRGQLSDHFPIWSEIIIDSSDDFLANKLMQMNRLP